jgi:hypothetical protein
MQIQTINNPIFCLYPDKALIFYNESIDMNFGGLMKPAQIDTVSILSDLKNFDFRRT